MRAHYFKIAKLINKVLSLEQCSKISSQKMILPFYHTVSGAPLPHFSELGYYREQEMFNKDLDFFQNNFVSVDIHDLDYSKKSFHLSFDDGLAENYSIAQLLSARKIHATFFINLDFIDNRKMFIRHKISIILNELKKSELSRKLISELMKTEEINVFNKVEELKDEEIVDKITGLLRIDFDDYLHSQKPYLSMEELKEIKKMGFTIGNHSCSHPHFSKIPFENQKKEIKVVNDFINNELSIEDVFFCFPFGDDLVKNEFFEWMYSDGKILKSFGTAGLKKDHFANHYHRILLENSQLQAEEIVKFEYFYYFIKSFLNKNKINR